MHVSKNLHLGRRAAAVALAAAVTGATLPGALAQDVAGQFAGDERLANADVENLVLNIGSDETQRNLAWYSENPDEQAVQLVEAGQEFGEAAVTVPAEVQGETTSGEYNHFATLTGLKPNTAYNYRVGSEESGWTKPIPFHTGAGAGDFSFLVFGDPQVGASGNLPADEAGWVDTVNVATKTHPESEFLFSVGDQVEHADNEEEYDSFFAPDQIREQPLVTVNGNHDVGSKAYEQHYNVPNLDKTAGAAATETSSGGDYWFIYNDVLFVVINSNNNDIAAHEQFIRDVVAEHGDEAKWKVMSFHHSIFSVADHVDDDEIKLMRSTFPQVFSELGFDVVLQGHDHSYTRSYVLDGEGKPAREDEVAAQDEVVAADDEVLYLTANSASGSKYYDIEAPDAEYASVINQEKVRNYTKVDVTDDELTFATYRSEENANGEQVNSVVDQVVLSRDAAEDPEPPAPQPEGPTEDGEAPIEDTESPEGEQQQPEGESDEQAPAPVEPTSPAPQGQAAAKSGSPLANTGVQVAGVAALAAVLVAGGAGALALARRRNS